MNTYLVVPSTPERRQVLRKAADAPLTAVDYAHDPRGWEPVALATTGPRPRLLPLAPADLPGHVARAFSADGALLPGHTVLDPNPRFWRVQILSRGAWRDVEYAGAWADGFRSYDTAETQAIKLAVREPSVQDWRVVPAQAQGVR